VDGLKALDPKWPIREADIRQTVRHVRSSCEGGPKAGQLRGGILVGSKSSSEPRQT
jgi:hypothetical protein